MSPFIYMSQTKKIKQRDLLSVSNLVCERINKICRLACRSQWRIQKY